MQDSTVRQPFNTGRCILITGGAGFFGSILTEHLLAQGNECIILDLHPSDFSHPALISIKGDIRDISLVK